MAVAYINQTIELPNVTAQQITHEIVGDAGRTAGGKYRRDVVAAKRVWSLECRYLTNAEYDSIVDYLRDTILFGSCDFWLDEFGGAAATDSITAYVEVEGDERVQFMGASWESQGRNLTLRIIEQ